MLTLLPTVRVFVAPEPIDLHLSFDRLSGLVRHHLRADPLSGHLFVFFNKTRTRTKIFAFDRNGYAIYYRRLERGTFQLPAVPDGATRVEIDAATLAMILGASTCALRGACALRSTRRSRGSSKPDVRRSLSIRAASQVLTNRERRASLPA